MPDARHTVALHQIRGLGWIDGFMAWPPIIRLPAITLALAAYLLLLTALGAQIGEVLSSVATTIALGGILAVFTTLARGVQADLEGAGRTDLLNLLEIRRPWLELTLAAAGGISVMTAINYAFYGHFAWIGIFDPRQGNLLDPVRFDQVLSAVLTWCFGATAACFATFVFRQSRALTILSAETPVDLLNMRPLEAFSAQPIRYLLIAALFTSLLVLTVELFLVGLAARDAVVLYVVSPIVLVILALGIPFGRPALLVRSRIRATKETELAAVRRALAGDRSALDATSIRHLAGEFTAPDLLSYEQRIQQIWEWPIQGSVQRILLYVMLPPLAWVLAALVERLVDMAL